MATILPHQAILAEKELERVEDAIKALRGQASMTAWGPIYTEEQKIKMAQFKSRKKHLMGKLGWMV